jgi:hypothetical protein
MNLYGFAGGDPVNYSDPFGLCPMCLVVGEEMLRGAVVGGVVGALDQMASNKLAGRPTYEGVAGSAAVGAGVGAATAGVGSAMRMAKAVSTAAKAIGFAEAEVATEAEADATADSFTGKGSRPLVDRRSGNQIGVRNDATGNNGRYVHTDRGMPTPHANLENPGGGNTHVKVNPAQQRHGGHGRTTQGARVQARNA